MIRRATSVLLLSVLSACSISPSPQLRLLDGAPRVELFTLRPASARMEPVEPNVELFHDYPVLGRATLNDPRRASELARLIQRGLDASDGSAAMCFIPRHGLRVERDGESLELVICYECLRIQAHESHAGAGPETDTWLTSQSVEPEVTRLFAELGLKIAGQ